MSPIFWLCQALRSRMRGGRFSAAETEAAMGEASVVAMKWRRSMGRRKGAFTVKGRLAEFWTRYRRPSRLGGVPWVRAEVDGDRFAELTTHRAVTIDGAEGRIP